MSQHRRTVLAFAAFVVVVLAANWATAQLGLTTVAGLSVTAGTWFAGFAFVARDYLDDLGGRRAVAAAIAAGATLSAAFAPSLALASGVAFLFSELADWAIYRPLRDRGHRTRAQVLSNTVGALVDTVLFLALAGFPLTGAPGQVLVKVATTTAFVLGVRACATSRTPAEALGR